MDEDFLLIYKMKKGNENAMEIFVRKYYPVILKYCQYRICNKSDVEDMVQETFYRFFKALPEYKHYSKLKNFLYRIAGNLCKDYYKKQSDLIVFEEWESEEDHTKSVEYRIDLEFALKLLSEEFQEVIILHYFQELKLKEIAEILEIGLPLVKYRIKKAKELLSEAIGKEEWI